MLRNIADLRAEHQPIWRSTVGRNLSGCCPNHNFFRAIRGTHRYNAHNLFPSWRARAMMGQDKRPQRALFYTGINLDKRVRSEHMLRKVAGVVDFDFVYGEVKESYGYNGHVSVPPPMILKLMLLLVLYNVRSERELMATLPERLDWLWFLGLGFGLRDTGPQRGEQSEETLGSGIVSKLF